MRLVNVPFFPGFYDSNLAIDEIYYRVIEEKSDPDSEYYDPDFEGTNINVKAYEKRCADIYTDYLKDNLVELHSAVKVKFESIYSPQFYNLGTDRLFIELDDKTIAELKNFAYNQLELWSKYLAENFTPRSGYMPNYSHDPIDWNKAIESYDHNETGSLLEFYLSQQDGAIEYLEKDTIEYLAGNTSIGDWLPIA